MTSEISVRDIPHKTGQTEIHVEPEMQSRSGLYPVPSIYVAHREVLASYDTGVYFTADYWQYCSRR